LNLILNSESFFRWNFRLTNLIYVIPERANALKYRILIDLIKCARNHRCINAVSVGINQVKNWVKEWKVSTEQIQELYRNMHEAYSASGDSYVFYFS
jgi:hypothetical protein